MVDCVPLFLSSREIEVIVFSFLSSQLVWILGAAIVCCLPLYVHRLNATRNVSQTFRFSFATRA